MHYATEGRSTGSVSANTLSGAGPHLNESRTAMGATAELMRAEADRSDALVDRLDALIVDGTPTVTLGDLATATRRADFARTRAAALTDRQDNR